jgi:plastocyanin
VFKKVILLAGAVGLLVVAPAPAKTVTVDISRLGFVPSAVTIETGDSVTWTNKDTVNHQVVCADCPFTSPVLTPGQTFTFTFTKTGKFGTVDPLNKNKKGTVTVTSPGPTLSLAASPHTSTYGGTTTLAGGLSTGQANQKVDILAQPCGDTTSKVLATVATGAGGAYTYQTRATLGTTYQARYKSSGAPIASGAALVSIRPVVKLKRVAAGRFSIQVVAVQSFVGKAVTFQRWVAARHRWASVKTVFLGTRAAASTPLTGSTASSTTFKAKVRRGLKVRAALPGGQAAPCYVAAKSAPIRS